MNDIIFIEAKGFSMWPFLREGERLVIKKAAIEDLRIGDIILYRKDEQLVCHRLVKKEKNGYLLYARGDNSSSAPELVTQEMFQGKVAGVLRKNGRTIDICGRQQRFLNRVIVIIAPLVAGIIKPCYFKLRNYAKKHISYRRS